LFPYKNDEKVIHEYVDNLIKFIYEANISYIVFEDEAIHPDVLAYFVDKVLENNLKIIYRFRTRFDSKYTLDFCGKIFDS